MTVLSIDDMVDYLEKLPGNLEKAVKRGLVSAANRGVQVITQEIIPSRSPRPEDRRVYSAGWNVDPQPDGPVIENTVPHAVFIEEGVRGENVKIGRAMLQALAEWAVRKGIVGANRATSMAWAIAKRMQQRGIFGNGQGLGILAELYERRIDAIIEEEVLREISREI